MSLSSGTGYVLLVARGHVAWEPYCNFIPDNERSDFVTAYSKRLNSPDDSVQVIFGPS